MREEEEKTSEMRFAYIASHGDTVSTMNPEVQIPLTHTHAHEAVAWGRAEERKRE